jgi:hypothetical protein
LFLAALLSGFLVSIKFSLILLMAMVLAGWAFRRHQLRRGAIPDARGPFAVEMRAIVLTAVLVAAGFGTGVLVGAPLANPRELLDGALALQNHYAGQHWPHGLGPEHGLLERLAYGLRFFLRVDGWPIIVFAVLGLVILCRRRQLFLAASLGIGLMYVALFCATPVFFERNYSHALPLILIAAGTGVTETIGCIRERPRRAALTAVIFLACLVPRGMLTYTLRYDVLSGNFDRRRASNLEELKTRCNCSVIDFAHRYAAAARGLRDIDGPLLLRVVSFGEERAENWENEALGLLAQRTGGVGGYERHRFDGPFHGIPASTLHTYFAGDDIVVFLPEAASRVGVQIVPLRQWPGQGQPIKPVSLDGWEINGHHSDVGVPNPAWPVYGSWRGADAGTGQAAFDVPKGCTRIVVPWASGPVPERQTLRLIWRRAGGEDGATEYRGVVSSDIWSLVVLTGPRGAEAVELRAVDAGDGWGEWSAISNPLCTSQ